ncbi:phosphotransferase [Fulvivirga sp. 29W222]|uniref:Phosphotransferase n=1 Tax=Fulvivirga marina TaxID=2494733 RepID=A0A937FSS4_9BACT|nr:phosphotransferase [Fulvivirga marina]MBL6444745.1 phosphotransferase [Fulvivirga marina]
MKIFPTQYSTLSSSALNDFVKEHYGLGETSCNFLLRGVSDTYLISNKQEKFILKIYRGAHRTLEEINGEVELLNVLKGKDAKVSYPLKDLYGRQIQEFVAAEGIRYGVLFSFAPGKVYYDFTDEQLKIIGKEIAYNHNITSGLDLEYNRKVYNVETTVHKPLKVLKPAFENFTEGYDYLNGISEKVIRKLEGFDTKSFGYGYCHYDYLPKNFHFDEGNNLTVFDYDFCGKGYLVNDLMTFQVHYFFHIVMKGMDKKEADTAFRTAVTGYRELRYISEEELEAIPYLGIMFWNFYLAFQYENFDDFSNTYFGMAHLQKWIGWMKDWENFYCKF